MLKKNLLVSLIMSLALNFCSVEKTCAQELDYKAYTLFVYNFMKYIEWPEESMKGEFVVGVMGDSPVFNELLTLSKSKKVKGRTLIIRKVNSVEEALTCHLVYLSPSKSNQLKVLNEKLKGKPVLLVGEREGLATKGASLSFVTLEDDVLKFEINKAEIDHHSLKIPSSLIALGIVVR